MPCVVWILIHMVSHRLLPARMVTRLLHVCSANRFLYVHGLLKVDRLTVFFNDAWSVSIGCGLAEGSSHFWMFVRSLIRDGLEADIVRT